MTEMLTKEQIDRLEKAGVEARERIALVIAKYVQTTHGKCDTKSCIVDKIGSSPELAVVYAMKVVGPPQRIGPFQVRDEDDMLGMLCDAYFATYMTSEERIMATANLMLTVAEKYPDQVVVEGAPSQHPARC